MDKDSSRLFPVRLEVYAVIDQNMILSTLIMFVERPAGDHVGDFFGISLAARGVDLAVPEFVTSHVGVGVVRHSQLFAAPTVLVPTRILQVWHPRQDCGIEVTDPIPELFTPLLPIQVKEEAVSLLGMAPHFFLLLILWVLS